MTDFDGSTYTSNTVRNAVFGFSLGSTGAKAEPNTIAQTSDAIDFLCDSNNTVKSNRIDDARVALANVPSGTTSTNTYSNVPTIKTTRSDDTATSWKIAPRRPPTLNTPYRPGLFL